VSGPQPAGFIVQIPPVWDSRFSGRAICDGASVRTGSRERDEPIYTTSVLSSSCRDRQGLHPKAAAWPALKLSVYGDAQTAEKRL